MEEINVQNTNFNTRTLEQTLSATPLSTSPPDMSKTGEQGTEPMIFEARNTKEFIEPMIFDERGTKELIEPMIFDERGTKELIEPMIFDERGTKELIEPMIFDERGTKELIEPMIFDERGTKELIEPMIFDERGTKELIEPMIFDERGTKELIELMIFDERGTKELIEPIIFDERGTKEPIEPMIFDGRSTNTNTETEKVLPDFSSLYTKNMKEYSDNSPCVDMALPEKSINVYKNTSNGVKILPNSTSEQNKITPFETTLTFLSYVNIIILSEEVYVYNGFYYAKCSDKDLERLIMHYCNDIIEKVGYPHFVNQIADFVKKNPKLCITEECVARHLLSFENGILNTITGEFFEHSSQYVTLYGIKGRYLTDSNALCPQFDKFLYTITGGDILLIERIWQMIGYILSPDLSAKVFFLLQGVQNSGKSVLTKVISDLFTENAVMPLDVHSFSKDFSIAELHGKSLCISPDLPDTYLDSGSVSKIKQISGNDRISSNRKFKEFIKFQCTAKLILATNHPLLIKSKDDAFYDRIVTIPFAYSIPKGEQNSLLVENLSNERDAIITKGMLAFYRLKHNHYKFAGDYLPNRVVMDTNNYNANITSNIFYFVKNNFVQQSEGIVFTSDAYTKFVDENGYISLKEFSEDFYRFTYELYGGMKYRKRKEGAPNPLKCVTGIAWKEDIKIVK